MHFDKSAPKEKPCCTLPTVKKLLEEKRRHETSLPSCAAAVTGAALPPPAAAAQVTSQEPFPCAGASGSFSDMPVSYDPWSQAPEPAHSYYPGQPGPSYAYDVQVAPDFGPQQQLHGFVDPAPQIYDFPMPVADQGATPGPSWPLAGPGTAAPLNFGTFLDPGKVEEFRMQLREMDGSRAAGQDEDGDTILHICTAKGLRECAYAAAEKLRELGKLDAKEHKGKTALLVAVTANQPEIVQDLLCFGADINASDVKGQTPLHLAAYYGFALVLQVILSMRQRLNLEACDFEGMTPLHRAAVSHNATAKALSAGGAADDGDANFQLLQSKAKEKLFCVQLLLDAGAALLSKEIKSNKTVLHLAVKEGNIHLVRFLLRIPLTNMAAFVNMKAHGHTALHMAAGLHGHPQQEEIIRLLLCGGADPSVRNLENELAAHLLQSGEQGAKLKLMLKKKNAPSRRRVTSSQDQE